MHWTLDSALAPRTWPIILAATALLAAACQGSSGGSPGRASDATVIRTPTPSATPAGPASVWVLTPVGLRVHADHSTTSQTLTTAARGIQLDVLGSATGSDGAWLRVRGHEGSTEGWIKDDPDLVTRREMTFFSASVDGWSMLYPVGWQAQAGNPATFTGEGMKLTVQFGSDPNALLAIPGSQGHAVRDEGPVEAYGVTVYYTIYALDKGGFEYDVRVRVSPAKVYGFQMSDPSTRADATLFRQILDSTVLG